MKFPYKRVLIVGCGGAGKSTLAIDIGKRFGLPVIHLDKIWWLPNWVSRKKREFDSRLRKELAKTSWVIEGNYARTFKKRLKYADFCIFLDYSTELCIQSVYERVEKYKGKTRPDITEGCLEQADDEFKDWIYNFNNDVRPKMLKILKNSSIPFMIFNNREDTEQWIESFDI